MLIPGAALCDRFTKTNGKRGRAAKESFCAVCETMWRDHFTTKDPSRYPQQSVLHPEMMRGQIIHEERTARKEAKRKVREAKAEAKRKAREARRKPLIPGALLCDRFTMQVGKRGRAAKESFCAVCETMWLDHFTEKDSNLNPQQSVLYPEMVRDIPVPKRHKPKAEKPSIEVEVEEPEVEEPDLPDLMLCGHPIEALAEVDGVEGCQDCVASQKRAERLWAAMKQHWMDTEKARHPEMTPSKLEAVYQAECEDW